MKFSYLLYVAFLLSLNSCGLFSSAETYDPYSTIPDTREEIMQDSVSAMVKTRLSNGKPYKVFGFSDLKVFKPFELKKLDSLFALKYKLSNSSNTENILKLDKVNDKIEVQRKLIKENDIHSTYKLEHIFTIGESNATTLYEYSFTLDYKYKIIDVSRKMEVELNEKMNEVFYHYFYEYPISSDSEADKNFYNSFRSKLESINSSSEKSAFMNHLLKVLDYSIIKSEVSLNKLTQRSIAEYFDLEKKYYKNYTPSKTSEIRGRYEVIDDTETMIGIEIDHLFKFETEDGVKESGLRIYLDQYYQIVQIYELEAPYEKYFK